MLQFAAFINLKAEPIPESQAIRWNSALAVPGLHHTWSRNKDGAFFMLQGDCTLENCFYTSPDLTLICHADLVDPLPVHETPAALLARLYEEHGDDFAKDLHGWFGIILYDHQQGRLKAWTDHFGVRRLVYSQIRSGLAIASDLRLLLRFLDPSAEIDPVAILEYLQYSCIPAPRTIYKGCSRLQPGHYISNHQPPTTIHYWDMTYNIAPSKSKETWAHETEAAIREAVSRHIKTTNPASQIGCFLSGGTDSSSVSGLVGKLTEKPPRTFSIGFDDPRYNEIYYARVAARHFAADHHEYFVKPQDILDLLPKAAAAYDEPFGNSSIIPAYYCARMAADNGVTHMLAGDGGDELFGGNQRYADDRIFRRYNQLPRWLQRGLTLAPVEKARRYARRAAIPLPDRWHSYDFISTVPLQDVFSAELLASLDGCHPLAASRLHYRKAATDDALNRWLYLDVKITLTDNDLRKVTPMTELAGTTVRYPLLDPRLAEFSGTIPPDLKVRGTQLRYLFKKALSELLPAEVIKKKKHGFGLPFSVWLGENEALKQFALDTIGSRAFRQRGYFRQDLIDRLWSQYQTEHPIFYGDVLWLFLMLELWHLSANHFPRSHDRSSARRISEPHA